jgi:hypothetical protein
MCMSATMDWFWIHCRIYWTLWYSTWLQFTGQCYIHTHISVNSQVSNSHCSLAASNVGRSPSSRFLNCPLASATSFTQQQFTTAEPQRFSNSLTRCNKSESEPKLCYHRWSVGQSLLEWSSHLGSKIRSLLLSDSCWFVDVWRPLWRQDWSVVYNCCWSSPAQSFSGPSPAVV